MKITAETIKREVGALKRLGKKAPFYLLIGLDTDLEATGLSALQSGEDVSIIQDKDTPKMFLLLDEAGFNYLGNIT